MAIQVISRRRARFRRATSGSQNLTMLIYNILKEQIASKKSAILSAFEANMSAKSYDSTYGGQAVDRAAVEAFYREMIAAFPAGTTEHDKLVAELNKFHSDAIYAEMKAYRDAYETGTFAFGEKVDLERYLAFLREAKMNTGSEADRQEYNVEEFIVTFNDVNSDMKAKGAGAGAMAKFYRRELSRAEAMGITKDSEAYRKIQIYLRDAEKQAAAEYKNNLYKNAVNDVTKQAALIAGGIYDALKAAQSRGVISANELIAITGEGVLDTVKNFASLDQGIQARIIGAAIDAGVKVGKEDFNSSFILDKVSAMREVVLKLANSDVGGAAIKSQMLGLLNTIDNSFTEPFGLITDIEKAEKSSLQFVIDQEHVFGNPVAKADLYARHASNIEAMLDGGQSGQAVKDIFRGLVPDGGREFLDVNGNPKKFLWQLSGEEVNRLTETYTGLVYIFMPGVDAKQVIGDAVNEYKSKHDVETGRSFIVWTIRPDTENSNNPVIEVVASPKPVTGGIPTISGPILTDDTEISIAGSQAKIPVYAQDGATPVGYKFFEISNDGTPVFKFLTTDNLVMDWDAFERYSNERGILLNLNNDGTYGSSSSKGDEFVGATIAQDAAYADYVSDTPFTGVAKGPNYGAALRKIGSEVANSVVGTRGSGSAFTVDQVTGAISVVNSDAARMLTGLDKAQLEAILNEPGPAFQSLDPSRPVVNGPNEAAQAVGAAIFRASERDYYAATAGQALPQSQLDSLRLMGARAAEDYQRKITSRERSDIYSRSPVLNNPFSNLGMIPDSKLLGLSEKDATRLSELEASIAQKEQRTMELAGKDRMNSMSLSPMLSGSVQKSTITPSSGSEYFFRYSNMGSGIETPQLGGAGGAYGYGVSGLDTAPSYPKVTVPKFTEEQVQQSLIDFRAGERAPL